MTRSYLHVDSGVANRVEEIQELGRICDRVKIVVGS